MSRSDLGTIKVEAGQRWRVRDGFCGVGLEFYVVRVKRSKRGGKPVAIVHARSPLWMEGLFEEHRLPLDERWSTGFERL